MKLAGVGLVLMLASAACAGATTSEASRPKPSAIGTTAPVTSAKACSAETSVTVPGRANVFGAGIAELPAPGGGGGGVAPVCVDIPEGTSTVTVPRATGLLSFTPLRAPDIHLHKCPGGIEAILAYGPDGNTGGCPGDVPGGAITAAGAVSGIASRGGGGYLVGVFLPPQLREAAPPATLDFTGRYDFQSLAPGLAQLFFVGDGRTEEGSLQRFEIPARATRLYLGIADAVDFRGPPGFYEDNRGRFRVQIRFE